MQTTTLQDIAARLDTLTAAVLSNKTVLTIDEAAAYTGLSVSSIYKLTSTQEIPHYAAIKGAFNQIKPKDDGSYDTWPLCDFTCKIMQEVTAEDGLNDASFLRIEGRRSDGLPLPAVDVPARSFYNGQGSWANDAWGTVSSS